MGEPVGLFVQLHIDEPNLKRLLNHKFEPAPYKPKLGYYFAELVHQHELVFLLNYDTDTSQCFIAYLINHYDRESFEPLLAALPIMSSLKDPVTTDYAMIATTFPELIEAYRLTSDGVERIDKAIPAGVIEELSLKFWSFAEDGDFLPPSRALNKRKYYYKTFRNYYRRYLAYLEEIEKPRRIAEATEAEPYQLFGDFYTFDNKVFQFRDYTNQVIELPGADPHSFRDVAGMVADDSHVFTLHLAPGSPPSRVKHKALDHNINNPAAVWMWSVIDGIDGATFDYVKDRWDTAFYKDKDSVFATPIHEAMTRVDGADSATFEYLGFGYGRDKNHTYYHAQVLPIDPDDYTLDRHGFLRDRDRVYHYNNELPLDGPTLRVLKYESDVNPFLGPFVLEDKNGRYRYDRDWDGGYEFEPLNTANGQA